MFEKTTYSGQKRSDNRLIADFSKIPDGAVIRNRRLGDTFEKFGGGTKKLKDYLNSRNKFANVRHREKLPGGLTRKNDIF